MRDLALTCLVYWRVFVRGTESGAIIQKLNRKLAQVRAKPVA